MYTGVERHQQQFAAALSSHGVWLSCRVCLSARGVEELLGVRRILVTDDALRP